MPTIPCADDAAIRSAIESLNQAFVAAWNAPDPGKMAEVWSEADLEKPFGMKAHGRAEIEKVFQTEQRGAMRASTFTIESSSIRQVGPGVVVQDMSIAITGMLSPDGKALPAFHPRAFEVLIKKGGHWRVEHVRAYAVQATPAAADLRPSGSAGAPGSDIADNDSVSSGRLRGPSVR
jgi:uncharacterized protein (TIGR02246 family)